MLWMISILSQLELGHIFIAEHVKLNHQQLLYMLGIIMITQVVHQIIWNKAKLFISKSISIVINKIIQVGDKVHRAFTQHHDSLFNSKFNQRQTSKSKRASKRYITNKGRIAQRRGNNLRFRAVIMIAMTQMAKSKASVKNKLQNTKNEIQNDNQVQRNKETWSEKNILWELDSDEIFANHTISNDGCVDDDELVAFSSNLQKATPALCKMDTDSFAIDVNSYASRCISPFIKDFVKGSLKLLNSSKR